MLIEEGKFYKTRDGYKVGPMQKPYADSYDFWGLCGERDRVYLADGTHGTRAEGGVKNDPDMNIVAEWSEGPVREVVTTRREIVPGVYDRLEVLPSVAHSFRIRLVYRDGLAVEQDASHFINPKELRTLIENLTALQEVIGK